MSDNDSAMIEFLQAASDELIAHLVTIPGMTPVRAMQVCAFATGRFIPGRAAGAEKDSLIGALVALVNAGHAAEIAIGHEDASSMRSKN